MYSSKYLKYILLSIAFILILVIGYFEKRKRHKWEKHCMDTWLILRKGYCPRCNQQLENPLPHPSCTNCGILAPNQVKQIIGKCSFCGGEFERVKVDVEIQDVRIPHFEYHSTTTYERRCLDCGRKLRNSQYYIEGWG